MHIVGKKVALVGEGQGVFFASRRDQARSVGGISIVASESMLKEGRKSVTIVIGKRVGAAEDLAGGSSRGSSQAPVGGNAVSQGIERVVVSVVCSVCQFQAVATRISPFRPGGIVVIDEFVDGKGAEGQLDAFTAVFEAAFFLILILPGHWKIGPVVRLKGGNISHHQEVLAGIDDGAGREIEVDALGEADIGEIQRDGTDIAQFDEFEII